MNLSLGRMEGWKNASMEETKEEFFRIFHPANLPAFQPSNLPFLPVELIVFAGQAEQESLHLFRQMLLADLSGGNDAKLYDVPGLWHSAETREDLPALKVGGWIIGIVGNDLPQFADGGFIFSLAGILHRQGITKEGILRIRSQHFFDLA